jgi:hypothetical protein
MENIIGVYFTFYSHLQFPLRMPAVSAGLSIIATCLISQTAARFYLIETENRTPSRGNKQRSATLLQNVSNGVTRYRFCLAVKAITFRSDNG